MPRLAQPTNEAVMSRVEKVLFFSERRACWTLQANEVMQV